MSVDVHELATELRFASHELMRASSGMLVAGERATAYSTIGDSITLDLLVERLEAGNLSSGLARLFLDAARTILARLVDELEAAGE